MLAKKCIVAYCPCRHLLVQASCPAGMTDEGAEESISLLMLVLHKIEDEHKQLVKSVRLEAVSSLGSTVTVTASA